uniref:Uncharacterized protein n=1 Tax=Anopheles atroparvus TaxID=41427 RepID=A0AAG5DHF0_ANOAO
TVRREARLNIVAHPSHSARCVIVASSALGKPELCAVVIVFTFFPDARGPLDSCCCVWRSVRR